MTQQEEKAEVRSYCVKMVMKVKESSSCRTFSSCFMVAVSFWKDPLTA